MKPLRTFQFKLFFFGVLFSCLHALPLQAYWEHGSISQTTKLPSDRPAHRTASFLFDDNGLYPGKIYFPGNSTLTITVCNVASYTIHVRRPDTSSKIMILPGRKKTIPFGKMTTGTHIFFIDAAPIHTPDTQPAPGHAKIPTLMKCFLHATQWPGTPTPYRTSVVWHQGAFYPPILWIPAGKPVNIFCVGMSGAPGVRLNHDDYSLQFIPGKITLTEIPASAGKRITFPAGDTQPPFILRFR